MSSHGGEALTNPGPHSLLIGLIGLPGTRKGPISRAMASFLPYELAPPNAPQELIEQLASPDINPYQAIQRVRMRYLLREQYSRDLVKKPPIVYPKEVNWNDRHDLRDYHAWLRRHDKAEQVFQGLDDLHDSIALVDSVRHLDDAHRILKHGGVLLGYVCSEADRSNNFVNGPKDIEHDNATLPGSTQREAERVGSQSENSAIEPCLYLAKARGTVIKIGTDFTGALEQTKDFVFEQVVDRLELAA